MPPSVSVVFYQERPGHSPVLKWLNGLYKKDNRGFGKCHQRLDYLATEGDALGRPYAAPLRDGIKELRVRSGKVQYRMLYFSHKGGVVVVAHGLTKTKKTPADAIDLAVARRKTFRKDPDAHSVQS